MSTENKLNVELLAPEISQQSENSIDINEEFKPSPKEIDILALLLCIATVLAAIFLLPLNYTPLIAGVGILYILNSILILNACSRIKTINKRTEQIEKILLKQIKNHD